VNRAISLIKKGPEAKPPGFFWLGLN